ncbi:MAG: glycosyltransferase family 4 protein [Bacillota bacterium]
MKKYLVVTPGYPSGTHKYSNAFVHARVRNYIAEGLNVEVFSVDRKPFARRRHGAKYVYEAVSVEQGNVKELAERIKKEKYEKILIHYGLKRVVSAVIKAAPKTPLIIWFHGVDIIAWHRRLYNLRFKNVIKFAGYTLLNTLQRVFLHRAIKKHGDTIHCVFVSDWLKSVAERDIHSIGKIKHYSVIPNIIDEKVFPYRQKKEDDRLRILTIRSFESKKYANDLTVKAIQELAKKPFFNELKFTFCGDGRLWKSTVKPLKQYPNVQLQRRFFSHSEIVELHAQNGVMLMPSYQDTHGISTCEGMSSGLVPISSNNSAIPEYVPDSCGYLADNYMDLAEAVEDLYNNPEKFLEYSKKASDFIHNKCGVAVVIKREIELIKKC